MILMSIGAAAERAGEEPITPLAAGPRFDPARAVLGRKLFHDRGFHTAMRLPARRAISSRWRR